MGIRFRGRVVALAPLPDGGVEAVLEDGTRLRVALSAPSRPARRVDVPPGHGARCAVAPPPDGAAAGGAAPPVSADRKDARGTGHGMAGGA